LWSYLFECPHREPRRSIDDGTIAHAPNRWHDLVCVSEAGTPIVRANLRRAFDTVAKAAKAGRVRPYDARHTACSLLCDAGVPLEHVADVLGHESTRMASQVYRHAIAPSITAGVAAMGRLLGPNDTESGSPWCARWLT
jgi:integrase